VAAAGGLAAGELGAVELSAGAVAGTVAVRAAVRGLAGVVAVTDEQPHSPATAASIRMVVRRPAGSEGMA
jgi:hypothetical protein